MLESPAQKCPCGSPEYATCCAPYHQGLPAPDALSLMRSRYSAYVLGLSDYLLATWPPDTRPDDQDSGGDTGKWLGLEIKNYTPQSDDRATVEFVARYNIAGRAHRLHECSHFERVEGRWLYLDGDFLK